MNSPKDRRKRLGIALIVVAICCSLFPAKAQNNIQNQSSDRSSKELTTKEPLPRMVGEGSQNYAANSPRLVVQLGHSAAISSIGMSPDGRMVITAGDTTARLWDVETGKESGFFSGILRALFQRFFRPMIARRAWAVQQPGKSFVGWSHLTTAPGWLLTEKPASDI